MSRLLELLPPASAPGCRKTTTSALPTKRGGSSHGADNRTTLAGRCDILQRALGLSGGSLSDVVHRAAAQLGVDISDGRSHIDIAKSCMEVLGVEPSPGGSGSDRAGGDGGGEGGASAADADITLCFEAEPTPFWSAANPDANGRPRCFDWHRRGMCRAGATCCFSHL